MVINAPSLANINFMQFGEQVEQLVEGGVRFFHVDIMDGHYVPNLCFPPTVVRDLKEKYPECTVEVHLMVDDPISYLEKLKEYGADYVSFHADSTNFVVRTLMAIKKLGMKAGIVL
ncbi:MAG: ribulose-phosphate 3-epimerase, partial [Oscillospiraceae bacterium]